MNLLIGCFNVSVAVFIHGIGGDPAWVAANVFCGILNLGVYFKENKTN